MVEMGTKRMTRSEVIARIVLEGNIFTFKEDLFIYRNIFVETNGSLSVTSVWMIIRQMLLNFLHQSGITF